MRALQALRTAAGASLDEAGPASPEQRRLLLATRVAAAVLVLGLAASLVFGGLWWRATKGSAEQEALARDDALAAARQIAVNLQTLDYRSVDKGLATWEASATGPLLDEFTKNHEQYADEIRKVQTSSHAQVLDVALADLDMSAGKAKAIAAVDVSTTQAVDGVPSLPVTKQVRIQLELVRTPNAGWKADAANAIRS